MMGEKIMNWHKIALTEMNEVEDSYDLGRCNVKMVS